MHRQPPPPPERDAGHVEAVDGADALPDEEEGDHPEETPEDHPCGGPAGHNNTEGIKAGGNGRRRLGGFSNANLAVTNAMQYFVGEFLDLGSTRVPV